MRSNDSKEKQFILYLIKSCENFELTEKELIATINKVLDKDIYNS